ncbi:DUF805 domain-containing protein [Halovulum sp. GXIMD14793]
MPLFSGRTGRIAWLLHVIVLVPVFLVSIAVYVDLDHYYREFVGGRLRGEEREQAELILYVAMGASSIMLLAATIRRLRDAGSKWPFLHLILGLAAVGVGWFLLALQLLFGKETKEASATQVPHQPKTRRARQSARKTDRDQLIAHITEMAANASQQGQQVRTGRPDRAQEFISQVEGASQRRLADAAHVHVINISPEGPTVRRRSRGVSAGRVRRVAF